MTPGRSRRLLERETPAAVRCSACLSTDARLEEAHPRCKKSQPPSSAHLADEEPASAREAHHEERVSGRRVPTASVTRCLSPSTAPRLTRSTR